MSPEIDRATVEETADSRWAWLYRISALTALITIILIPVLAVIYVISPPPGTAVDYFALFQENKLLGLMSLDLGYLVTNVLSIPVFLAFYVALKRASRSFAAIAAALGFAGIIALFASNPAFGMLNLSNQYAAATTEAQRALYLGAGEALLANYTGSAFQVHYVVGALALLIVSFVMLRSDVFSRLAAWFGIIANVLAFGLYVPQIGVYISLISVFPFLLVWYILVGLRFFRMGRSAPASR